MPCPPFPQGLVKHDPHILNAMHGYSEYIGAQRSWLKCHTAMITASISVKLVCSSLSPVGAQYPLFCGLNISTAHRFSRGAFSSSCPWGTWGSHCPRGTSSTLPAMGEVMSLMKHAVHTCTHSHTNTYTNNTHTHTHTTRAYTTHTQHNITYIHTSPITHKQVHKQPHTGLHYMHTQRTNTCALSTQT